jgi:hypothetical protein
MTEAKWNSSLDVRRLLPVLRKQWRGDQETLEKKLHRYYVACCRAIWQLLPQQGSREGVEVAERYLEGEATREELRKVDYEVEGAAFNLDYNGNPRDIRLWVQAARAISKNKLRAMLHPVEAVSRELLTKAAYFVDFAVVYPGMKEKNPWAGDMIWAGCDPFLSAPLLREMFGNPFHPSGIDPSWLSWNGGTVVHLAQGIYDERAFDRLPILADALEDAGCPDVGILAHCRGPGPHARGCWVVDLLLGKT